LWEQGQAFAVVGDNAYGSYSYQLIYTLPQEVGCLNGSPQSQQALCRSNPRPHRSRLSTEPVHFSVLHKLAVEKKTAIYENKVSQAHLVRGSDSSGCQKCADLNTDLNIDLVAA